MQEAKFLTIFGTWIKASDVDNPDELVDPTEYWDYVTEPRESNDSSDDDSEIDEDEDFESFDF